MMSTAPDALAPRLCEVAAAGVRYVTARRDWTAEQRAEVLGTVAAALLSASVQEEDPALSQVLSNMTDVFLAAEDQVRPVMVGGR